MTAYIDSKQIARYYNAKYFAYVNKFKVGIDQGYKVLILKRKEGYGKGKQEYTLGAD